MARQTREETCSKVERDSEGRVIPVALVNIRKTSLTALEHLIIQQVANFYSEAGEECVFCNCLKDAGHYPKCLTVLAKRALEQDKEANKVDGVGRLAI